MNPAARLLILVLLVGAYGLAYAASSGTTEMLPTDGSSFQTDLNSMTTLRLHVRDGDFRIVASDSEDVTIRTEGKNVPIAKRVKVHLERTGETLNLTFSNVPKKDCQITIAVPTDTNLYARMRAGDLSVDGITGDKDLEMLAGDLSIQVPDASDYGPVDLSVKFGDVSGSPFGDPKGSVGNSLKRNGNGKYRLHAHLFAGDLMLKP